MTLQETIYAHEMDKLCERVWRMYARTCMDDMLSEPTRAIIKNTLKEISAHMEKTIERLRK